MQPISFIKKAMVAMVIALTGVTGVKAADALPTTLESQSVPTTDFHLTARPWSPLNVASSAYTARLLAECRYWATEESGGQIKDPYGAANNGITSAEYAESVATLLKAGAITTSDSLVASGARAMTYAVGDANSESGLDFFIPPMAEALALYKPFSGTANLPAATYNGWVSGMNTVYRGNGHANNNWTTYYMRGEWIQFQDGLSNVTHSAVTSGSTGIDTYWNNAPASGLSAQKNLLTSRWNLYSDWVSGNLGPVSLSTELAGRTNLLGIDYLGYDGSAASAMDPLVERATYTSLLMQDPSGQNPCGGRTDDHCWVDTAIQTCSEMMAEKVFARGGTTNTWQAGQFRHASMLTFNNLNRWARTSGTFNGSFYVTKNQYDPSLAVGYQTASTYNGYNGNVMDLTALSYNIRHSTITENPAPSEIGGYAFETDSNPSAANAWAGAFADAGGVFMQAALRGDTTQLNGNVWTSVGINRFGRPGWDTRLGPSDGASNKSANNGVSFAPAWLTSGTWNLMASHPGGYIGAFTTTLATPCLTRCQIVWSGSPSFTQNFTITPDGILVQTTSSAASGTWGVTCPLLKDTDGTSATFTTQSVSSHIASVTHAPAAAGFNQSDSQNFLLINTNGAAMTSGTAVQSTYGDLTPVEASTSDATNSIFVYPATASDPSASTVLSGFTTSGSGTTAGYNAPGLNSKVTGNLYVGRTSAGGNGNSIDLNGDGVADVTFNGVTCNFILQLSNGTVTKVETDTNVTGAVVQGHTLNLTAYTPQSVSGGTPPAPPTNLTATVSGTSVILNWTAGSGDNTYNVQRSTTSGGPYSTIISGISTTTYTDKPSPTGTYYYVVSAAGTGGTSTNSNQASATTSGGGGGPLPTGQTDSDIGGSLPAGTASYSGGVYTLTGGGANIWDTADQFNYTHQAGSGDETIVARVTGLNGTNLNPNAKAGIMFRDSTAAGAIFVDIDYDPTGGGHVEFLYRSSTGAAANYVPGISIGVAAPSTTTPVWLKLVKTGTTYTAYYSTAVSTPTWTLVNSTTPSVTVSMTSNSNYLTGLDVCSLNNGTSVTGTFDNVNLGTVAAGKTDTDIGGSSPAGSGADNSGVYTLTGGGSDIWGTADQFNYFYQTGSGDETLIARVTGLSGTSLDANAKAGVQFRDSTAAGAVFVDVDYEPTGGGHVEFLFRPSTGAAASYVPGVNVGVANPSTTTPVWIKLVKTGTTYTGYYSTAVTTPTWTQFGSTTVSLTNSTYLTGLDVCSHNSNTALVTSTFDNVSP